MIIAYIRYLYAWYLKHGLTTKYYGKIYHLEANRDNHYAWEWKTTPIPISIKSYPVFAKEVTEREKWIQAARAKRNKSNKSTLISYDIYL